MRDIINITMGELTTAVDNEVMKAVQKVGIDVDKEELLKALELHHNLVRCKDCKHFRDTRNDELERTPNSDGWCKRISRWGDVKCVRANDYCSYGEREGE